MHIISLGGVGGCELAYALRSLNQPAYPYDWLITSQSFILQSFDKIQNFFQFDCKYLHGDTMLLDKNKKAIMLHDFTNFVTEKDTVKSKYERRFDRLNVALRSNEEILFVRMCDNLKEDLIPLHFYDTIFEREEEDIAKWEIFAKNIESTFNKKVRLLIITSNEGLSNKNHNNILIRITKEHKRCEKIKQIIEQEM